MLSTATITFDASDYVGSEFGASRTKVWATTNIPDNTVVDTEGEKIRLGSGRGEIGSDGTGSISMWIPGTGSNPASWQTTIHVDYPDPESGKGRTVRSFGPFTITESKDLSALIVEQEVPPPYLTTVTTTLQGYLDDGETLLDQTETARDEAEAARDAAAASAAAADSYIVADLNTSDGQMRTLIESPSSLTSATLEATAGSRASMNSEVAAVAARIQATILKACTGVFVRTTTPTANRTTTTLAATASSGAATLSLTAQLTPGRYKVDSETVTITAVTGAGPYTATLSAVTTAGHTSGATIATTELDYHFLHGIGSGRYVEYDLTWKTNNPPAYTYGLNQLGQCRVVIPMLSVHVDSGSFTGITGQWTNGINAGAYSGTYRHSNNPAKPTTWASPASTTALAWRGVKYTDGGLGKVTLSGAVAGAVVANLLPTAQQMVDRGLYPNTILTANGGSLATTDRVLDCWLNGLNYDFRQAIAEGLTADVYTVTLTPTGYTGSGNGTGSLTGGRTYLAGLASTTGATTPTTASAALFQTGSVHDEQFTSSAWEYADEERPTGVGTLKLVGNIHGYEQQDSMVVWLGDASSATTMATDTTSPPAAGGFIRLVRTSTIFHPDKVGTFKTCVTTYTVDRLGLQVESVMTYTVATEADLNYAMMPLNGLFSSSRSGGFNRVALSNNPGAITLPGSTDARLGRSKSGVVWAWQSGGNLAAMMWTPDTYGFTEGWARNAGVLTSVQDRTGQLTKFYFTWIGNRGGAKAIPAGFVKYRSARYLVSHLSDPEAALANA